MGYFLIFFKRFPPRNRRNPRDFPLLRANPCAHRFRDRTMGDFRYCIAVILAEEGGLANHRRDLVGLTQYGISQRIRRDLSIGALTKERAPPRFTDQEASRFNSRSWITISHHSNYPESHTELL